MQKNIPIAGIALASFLLGLFVFSVFAKNSNEPEILKQTNISSYNDIQDEEMLGANNTNTLGVSTPQNATIGTTTTTVISANGARKYALIVNDSDEAVYLGLGSSAVLNKGIRLNANGGSYEILGENLFRGTINAISTSGSKVLTYIEVTSN